MRYSVDVEALAAKRRRIKRLNNAFILAMLTAGCIAGWIIGNALPSLTF